MALFNTIRQFATNFPGFNPSGGVNGSSNSQTSFGLPFGNQGFPFGAGQNDSFQTRFSGGFQTGFPGAGPGAGFNGMTPPPKPDASEIDTNNDGSIDQAELLAFNPTDPNGNTITLPDTIKQQMASQILNGQTSITATAFNALQPPAPPPFEIGMGNFGNLSTRSTLSNVGSQLQTLINSLNTQSTGTSQNSDIATQLQTILNLMGNSNNSTTV